jgi:hypothetical protein
VKWLRFVKDLAQVRTSGTPYLETIVTAIRLSQQHALELQVLFILLGFATQAFAYVFLATCPQDDPQGDHAVARHAAGAFCGRSATKLL